MALLRAMHALSPSKELLCVVHFNHQWRGAESDLDARFVQDLSCQLGIECIVGRPSSPPEKRDEATARKLRYDFMVKTAYSLGARYVTTAHTASDRAETSLHNLFRGTGLAGMASLVDARALDEQLVLKRPLLHCRRSEVLEYLESIKQSFRTDASNFDLDYKRNFLRQEILPKVSLQYGPDVEERIGQFADLCSEFVQWLDSLSVDFHQHCHVVSQELQVDTAHEVVFEKHSLLRLPWLVVQHALTSWWHKLNWPLGEMNREHWQAIRDTYEGRSSDNARALPLKKLRSLPGGIDLGHSGSHVYLSRRQ